MCTCTCTSVLKSSKYSQRAATGLCQHTPDWRWHVTVLMLVFTRLATTHIYCLVSTQPVCKHNTAAKQHMDGEFQHPCPFDFLHSASFSSPVRSLPRIQHQMMHDYTFDNPSHLNSQHDWPNFTASTAKSPSVMWINLSQNSQSKIYQPFSQSASRQQMSCHHVTKKYSRRLHVSWQIMGSF